MKVGQVREYATENGSYGLAEASGFGQAKARGKDAETTIVRPTPCPDYIHGWSQSNRVYI